jgi:hypothetical protein
MSISRATNHVHHIQNEQRMSHLDRHMASKSHTQGEKKHKKPAQKKTQKSTYTKKTKTYGKPDKKEKKKPQKITKRPQKNTQCTYKLLHTLHIQKAIRIAHTKKTTHTVHKEQKNTENHKKTTKEHSMVKGKSWPSREGAIVINPAHVVRKMCQKASARTRHRSF